MTFFDACDEIGLGQGAAPARVLVVEDDVAFGRSLVAWLEVRGHVVVWLIGILRIEGSQAEGIQQDHEVTVVDLSTFDAAFLDHYFPSGEHNGTTVTSALVGLGCSRIVGMSSVSDANQRMLQAGARSAVRKVDAAYAIS